MGKPHNLSKTTLEHSGTFQLCTHDPGTGRVRSPSAQAVSRRQRESETHVPTPGHPTWPLTFLSHRGATEEPPGARPVTKLPQEPGSRWLASRLGPPECSRRPRRQARRRDSILPEFQRASRRRGTCSSIGPAGALHGGRVMKLGVLSVFKVSLLRAGNTRRTPFLPWGLPEPPPRSAVRSTRTSRECPRWPSTLGRARATLASRARGLPSGHVVDGLKTEWQRRPQDAGSRGDDTALRAAEHTAMPRTRGRCPW